MIPCKYTSAPADIKESYVVKSVASIRLYHPDEKILVVDSDSDDTSYLKFLEKIPNVIAADAKNKNYIDGAFWYAFENYRDEEWYCVLQDSITIKHSFDEFINGDELFYSLMWFNEVIRDPLALKHLETLFSTHLKKYGPLSDPSVVGCWGPCFLAKKEILTRLKDNNLDKCKSTNKHESQVIERLWGICLAHEGIDIKQNTMDGNFLAIATPRSAFNSKTKYHEKIYGGRP